MHTTCTRTSSLHACMGLQVSPLLAAKHTNCRPILAHGQHAAEAAGACAPAHILRVMVACLGQQALGSAPASPAARTALNLPPCNCRCVLAVAVDSWSRVLACCLYAGAQGRPSPVRRLPPVVPQVKSLHECKIGMSARLA